MTASVTVTFLCDVLDTVAVTCYGSCDMENCHCGAENCWDEGDYSWLSSNSGWGGEINGCDSLVFFIHGRKIREQRHLPEGDWPVSEMAELVKRWSEGLPNGRLVIMEDTGDGEPGFWIEGEREPNTEDWKRLDECRARQDEKDRREYERLQEKFQ